MGRTRSTLFCLICLTALGRAAMCGTIGQAKAAAPATMVSISGVIVTYVGTGECYVETPDRSSGIWVEGDTTGVGLGDIVSVIGTVSTVSGEVGIRTATIQRTGGPAAISPLGMGNQCVGGPGVWDFLPGAWVPRVGADTTGVLVRIWGKVRATYYSPITDAHWFYVDDGFGASSDGGDNGVLVYGAGDAKEGDYVAVNGISSIEPSYDDVDKLVRVIRMRDAGDAQVLKPAAQPEHPFSDEFNGPTLDPRWVIYWGHQEQLSLTVAPGWLTLMTDSPTLRNSFQEWGLRPS
ncbi:MAG: hypothetical protein M1335_03135 [Chloroflexi bacterium]|nr:hypothetical protein [Chloroflexota bacterium]